MSWIWFAPLAVGAVASIVLSLLARAVERERSEALSTRLRLAELPVRARRRR